MLDSLEKQNGLEAEKVRTLLDRNRDAHAIAEMAKRSIDPLTMTHQYLSNITLILQGKDPLP